MGRKQWLLVEAERRWDAARLRRKADRTPENFRIDAYLGHGGPTGVVVRGRALDNPPPTPAMEGEGVGGGAAPQPGPVRDRRAARRTPPGHGR